MNFDDYITACNEHLEETFEDRDGNEKFYYKIVSESALDTAKSELLALLQAGFDNKIITKEEFEEMWPKSKTASKFYCNFKIKKTYDHIPPVRPIISGSGSFVENPSKFIDHHIAELSNKHDSYIQDSPDCIKQIEDIHRKWKLPNNTLLASFDVKSLFTNIPQDEGTQCTEEALNERKLQKIPTEFIVSMLKFVLKNNLFNFSEKHFPKMKAPVWDQDIHLDMQTYSWLEK